MSVVYSAQRTLEIGAVTISSIYEFNSKSRFQITRQLVWGGIGLDRMEIIPHKLVSSSDIQRKLHLVFNTTAEQWRSVIVFLD